MGCTYDIIEATFKEEDLAEEFLEMFSAILGDELYDDISFLGDEISIEEFGDSVCLTIEGEPLFTSYEDGEQLMDVVLTFLSLHPEIKFEATYDCTFNNCGDHLYMKYIYQNNLLTLKRWNADFYLLGCPECEAEWDEPIYTMIGEDDICPSCGADLELAGVFTSVDEIPLIDGEWQLPEGWNLDCEDFDDDDF